MVAIGTSSPNSQRLRVADSERPEMRALAAARLHQVPVVVAKVDRLTRSVGYLSRLLEAGVDVRFADLPSIEGPAGRFMLQQMAAQEALSRGSRCLSTSSWTGVSHEHRCCQPASPAHDRGHGRA